MKSLFASAATKKLLRRCREDESTRLRNKYAPWYKVMESQQGTRVILDGRSMLMLSSNDYLGLTDHPKVIEAGMSALREWGSSTTGARSSNGGRRFHLELEEALAAFLGVEACQVSSAGYISCLSSVAAFARKGDVIIADRNLHSCLWEGIRLSSATVERFAHNDAEHLEEILAGFSGDTPSMVVVEGIYSMEGHICPLDRVAEICTRHGAFLVVDDAHGLGVLGRQGRGTADHFHCLAGVDVLCGSLSKALSSVGGFVAGSREVIEYLRTHSKQTIFSAALSPAQAACARAALQLMQDEPEHLERLWQATRRYRELLLSLGFYLWDSQSPAVPIVLGSKEKAFFFWRFLLEKGIFTVLSIAPGVPPGKDLVRTAVSARLTDEDFDLIESVFREAARKFL